jgi:Tfp pilus assembly protein PilF
MKRHRRLFAMLVAVSLGVLSVLCARPASADPASVARKAAQAALNDGIAKFNEGDVKESLKDFDKAVAADPTFPQA